MMTEHRANLFLSCIVFLSACGDANQEELSSPSATVDEPATPSSDAGLQASAHTPPEDRPPPPPPQLMPEDPAQLQRWKTTGEFRLKYSTNGCVESRGCLSFAIEVDQTGRLEFAGSTHVARPGDYEVAVSATDARALYENVLDQHVLQLPNFYFGGSSGSIQTNTEQLITLEIPGEEKVVIYEDRSRMPRAGFEELLGIVNTYESWQPIQHFIFPTVDSCYDVEDTRFEKIVIESVQTSWVIRSTTGESLGILAFIEPPDLTKKSEGYAVRVSNCQGEELFLTYHLSSYGCGFYMLPPGGAASSSPGENRGRLLDHDMNVALLGVEKDRSQIPDNEWNLRLLDANNETLFRMRRGDSCD